MWLLREKWPIQGDCSKPRFWYRCFGIHLWAMYFTGGIFGLATVVFWYSSVTFLACICEVSDITVYHHIIGVSDKTSVNFKGTNLRLECLGELLYWFSILLFTLKDHAQKPKPNLVKPDKRKWNKMKQNQKKQNQTEPNQTRPNQTKPKPTNKQI